MSNKKLIMSEFSVELSSEKTVDVDVPAKCSGFEEPSF